MNKLNTHFKAEKKHIQKNQTREGESEHMTDFTAAAVAAFKKGAAHDEAAAAARRNSGENSAEVTREYEHAYKHYLESVEIFMTATKYDKNDVSRNQLKRKAAEIIDRATKIKEYLDAEKQTANHTPAVKGNESSNSTKMAKPGDKKPDDDDNSRLKGALSGAIVTEKPNVRWEDIGGLEGAKSALREAVILPTKFPQLFAGSGLKPSAGILLYGPPGTGKSLLAKAVASQVDGNFFSVSSSDLMSRWLGESEKLVKTLFQLARDSHKESGKPSIIFVDEIDSLCGTRSEGENDAVRRIKTEFLVQMQGVGHDDEGILVLGATNIPWGLDSAIRRRFERRIYIPLPDTNTRAQMLRIFLSKATHTLTEDEIRRVAERTEMYSGSDVNVLVRLAMMEPIRTMTTATHFRRVYGPDPDDASKECDMRLVPCSPSCPYGVEMNLQDIPDQYSRYVLALPVDYSCFMRAMSQARSSVNDKDIAQHVQWTEEFGSEGN